MKISISLKWTISAVIIVIIIVAGYAYSTIQGMQKSVEQETERIQRIQYQALDELGSKTTFYISRPASSLLYDNDREGLSKLLNPVVGSKSEAASYYAVYSTIIDTDGRVWAASVSNDFDKLKLGSDDFYDKNRDEAVEKELSSTILSGIKTSIKASKESSAESTKCEVQIGSEKREIEIRQYAHKIVGNDDDEQGYLLIGYSMDGLNEEIASIRAQGEERKREAIDETILLALLAIAIGLVISIIQSLLVTRNIKKLSKAANQIASGDLSVRSDVKSHDEIGQLGDQFNVMADRVQALLVETEQKAMLEKEVDIARSIQTTLLPPTGAARCGCVELNGYFQPASECGGDFWSYNLLPDHSVLLTIGDVTGHGVPSAMITACAKSALDTLLNLTGPQNINLPQMVASLNAAICQAAKRTLFMTFQAIRISADGRTAEVVNAGHNFPLLIHEGRVQGVVVRGERLGDTETARYEKMQVNLAPGDMFLLYTDGLTEYMNDQQAEYGEKHLRKVIAPCGAGNVTDAMHILWGDFETFCGNAPQKDDITLMFAKV